MVGAGGGGGGAERERLAGRGPHLSTFPEHQSWVGKWFANPEGSIQVLVTVVVNVVCVVCRKGPSSLACININDQAISAALVRPELCGNLSNDRPGAC